jgi:hypothetical protein
MDIPGFRAQVAAYRDAGWRLLVINAVSLLPDDDLPDGAYDVTWSFAREENVEHLCHRVLPGEEVPSVSVSFESAFLYENEMRELFGINVTGMNLDLGGQLYHGATVVPFSPRAIRERLEAKGAKS